jgi:hypothetical protein
MSRAASDMELIHHYIDLSWAMVGIFAIAHQPLLFHIPGIDKDEVAAEEHFFGLAEGHKE